MFGCRAVGAARAGDAAGVAGVGAFTLGAARVGVFPHRWGETEAEVVASGGGVAASDRGNDGARHHRGRG
jgi:hypothetical protein